MKLIVSLSICLLAGSLQADTRAVVLSRSEFQQLQAAAVLREQFPSISLLNGGTALRRISPDQRDNWKAEVAGLVADAKKCPVAPPREQGKVPAQFRAKVLGGNAGTQQCLIVLASLPAFCEFCSMVRAEVESAASEAGVTLRVLELQMSGTPSRAR